MWNLTEPITPLKITKEFKFLGKNGILNLCFDYFNQQCDLNYRSIFISTHIIERYTFLVKSCSHSAPSGPQ